MVYLIHFDKPLKHAQHYSVGKSSLTEAPYEYAKSRRGGKTSFFHRSCYDALLKKGDHNVKQQKAGV